VAGAADAKAAVAALRLERRLLVAGLDAGLAPGAVEDYLTRGVRAFGPGSTPSTHPNDPTRTLDVETWATTLRHTAPHLFGGRR
jgi:hypothetical protein